MSEWVSVKDRLPGEEIPVFVTWVSINGNVHSDAVAAIIHGQWYWWEGNADDSFEEEEVLVEITYWMPLPDPPKED